MKLLLQKENPTIGYLRLKCGKVYTYSTFGLTFRFTVDWTSACKLM